MKNYITIFDGGRQRMFKPCECKYGKILKDNTTLSDMYSAKELLYMDVDPNEVVDSKIICETCKKELEEI